MTKPTSPDDPFLPLAFSLYSNPGAYAVLAGAGISRGAGLPTAWDIVVDLVSQIASGYPDAVIDSQTAAPWYEARFGRTPTYSDVVEQLALTPTERGALLRKYFEPSEEGEDDGPVGPSLAHKAIARLMQAGVVRVVLTLNFDRLFEQALRELGIEPTIVATEGDAQGLEPLHTVKHCIIHLHGDYLNASSMLNTTAELSGYSPHMDALLQRVLADYGLLVAGWSADHDHALRDAIAAHYPSRFTMGWVSPGQLSSVASELAHSKKAISLQTTADDAFGHLADQVESMRERRARHPLSLAVAVSRVKRDLSRQGPAISAHDTLAAEFTQLRDTPAFHLDRFMDGSNYHSLLRQVVDAAKIPAGIIAALAYWGPIETDRWWMPEVERFSRPIHPPSGLNVLLDLPLVAGSLMFYSAGTASVLSQNYSRLHALLQLRGNRTGTSPSAVAAVLAPGGLADRPVAEHFSDVAAIVREALGLGAEPVDDALQTFEILRLCGQVLGNEKFDASWGEYGALDRSLKAMAGMDQGSQATARMNRDLIVGRVAEFCKPYGVHVLASERVIFEGQRIWGCPVAERMADDVKRLGDQYPLVPAWGLDTGQLWIALRAVSVAAGRRGDQLQMRDTPIGTAGFVPDMYWLDTEQPPS
jgi:hypothetical protein